MKLLRTTMTAMLLLLAPAYAFSASLGHLRLSLVEGDVQVMTPESGEWGIAPLNTPLAEGDQVWVPAGSRAELQLNNGTYIRLRQDSSLQVLSLEGNSSQFYLSRGRSYIYYSAPRGSVLQIDTPDASSRSFSRASFGVEVTDSSTEVAAYLGSLETENDLGKTRIKAGEIATLGEGSYGEIALLGPADAWEDWNRVRNRRLLTTRNGGTRHLPAELKGYSADLDNSGRWLKVPEYGYVWTPTADIDANWSPYREGRWIWRDNEYVWIASEPWGWAPYHYGRWAYVAGTGWCWAPPAEREVYWGPGYVGWVRTPQYVAWVPLAPGETYYGRGNYGPHSVNITNVNVTTINVTNAYRNVGAHQGVTVVNRSTFNTPSPVVVNINRNDIQKDLFVKANISVGAPHIKPTRESSLTSGRPVPPTKLPPVPLRNLRVQDLRHARPMVTEQGKSVLTPGAKPAASPAHAGSTPRSPGKERPVQQVTSPAQGGSRTAPGVPPPRDERPRPNPADRERSAAPGQPATGGARPEIPSAEHKRTGTPGAPVPTQVKPTMPAAERSKPGAPPVSVPPRSEQATKPQPQGRNYPGATPAPPQTLERPQAPLADKRRTAAPAIPAIKEGPQKAPLAEHKAPGAPGEPAAKDKNAPNHADQESRSR